MSRRFLPALALLAFAAASCQLPLLRSGAGKADLTLRLIVTRPASEVPPARSLGAARLLLTSAETLKVTVTGGDRSVSSQTLVVGGDSVAVKSSLSEGQSYTVAAAASDAAGTILFEGSAAFIVAGDMDVRLYLLPVTANTPLTPAAPNLSAVSIAAGTSQAWFVDLSGATRVRFAPPTAAEAAAGLTAYLQGVDGARLDVLPAPAGMTTDVYTIDSTVLGAETGFWLVYQNTGAAPIVLTVAFTFTVPVTGLALDSSAASLQVGSTQQLVSTVSPSYASDQALTWSSSDPAIVTVSATGLLTGIDIGSATITATSVDGSFTATCAVTVLVRARWAQSTNSPGSYFSAFYGLASDGAGGAWAVGTVRQNLTYYFGSGSPLSITTPPTANSPFYWEGNSAVLVRYLSDGTASVAKAVIDSSSYESSHFFSVARDPAGGGAYAAGDILSTRTYNFPGGPTATGLFGAGPSIVIAKFNAAGTTLWATTLSAAPYSSLFNAVAADSAGVPYAGGRLGHTASILFNFGGGVTQTTLGGTSNDWILVKYNPATGVPTWAKSTASGGTGGSNLTGLACDASGNIISVGMIHDGTYDFGNGAIATGSVATGSWYESNAVIVKYSPAGLAQWARTSSAGSDISHFNAVAVDAAGNSYAVGYIGGATPLSVTFGGKTVTPLVASPGLPAAVVPNALIVKYDSSGTVLWAKTASAAGGASTFSGVSIDSQGRPVVVGSVTGTSTFTFGGVSLAGPSTGTNALTLAYSASGNVLWAKTASTGVAQTSFASVAVDASTGNVFAGGIIEADTVTTFDSMSVSGTDILDPGAPGSGNGNGNILLLKY